MFTTWKRFDRWLDSHCPLLALIVILIVLRLPNFFEPYWYGDEGIYLTLGTAMRQGEHLYAQIIDHKTPLIYYLAMVPNQYYFRLLNLGWMIGSLILFNHLAKKLMKKPAAIFASGLFMLFTTMPWFEGHIPNGELFMIGFVLMGAYFFIQTNFFQSFFSEKTTEKKLSVGESINLLL